MVLENEPSILPETLQEIEKRELENIGKICVFWFTGNIIVRYRTVMRRVLER